MKRYLNWIVLCCLALFVSGCTPKVIEPVKDPFVLGSNPIKNVYLEGKFFADLKVDYPLTPQILSTETWVKTNQQVTSQTILKITLTDSEDYTYKFYKVSGRYLVVIKNDDYTEDHHYLVTEPVYDQFYAFILEKHIPKIPGIYEFVQGMLGKDESTRFDLDLTPIISSLKPGSFALATENIDLSRKPVIFSLIDDQGNLYHFYDDGNRVEFVSSSDQSVTQYLIDNQDLSNVWTFIKETYPDAMIVNQLQPVIFSKAYINGLASYSSSKLIPVSLRLSNDINEVLNLLGAYKTFVIPDEQSNCEYILKDDQGLYYVICYNPYVVGVGKDPKGPLTYYSLPVPVDRGIGDYLYNMPMPAPLGSRLDNFTFTKANAAAHCGCDIRVDLSSSQSTYLNNLMDLADHAVYTDDTSLFIQGYTQPDDLFIITTSSNLRLWFYIQTSTKTIIMEIDYNSQSQNGTTYYRIDSAGYNKILEAHFYIAGLLDTAKADANPTFDAFYLGDQLSFPAINDLPMTSLTSTQITTIDGLLQRTSWQKIALYDPALNLESKFVLRKDSNSYYVFSQFGTQSVVTLRNLVGESEAYIIPSKAFNDVLNALKLIK